MLMSMKFKSSISHVSDSALLWHFRIPIPDTVFQQFKAGDKRVICSINGSDFFHFALQPKGDGTYYLMINKELRKQLGLEKDDELGLEIKADESKYGMAVPDFFEELCFQDPEGSTYFHSMTAGKQRSLLHVIGKLKSEEKQLEKALIIFDYLKTTHGQLDFKELNEAFKTNRFKK